jgi:hypothetical protein
MKQLKVALPDGLRQMLEHFAKQSGRSLADEIRTRLERSLADETRGKPTNDFLFTIDHLVEMVERHYGYSWFEHPDSIRALSTAISARLDRVSPSPDKVLKEHSRRTSEPMVASKNPEAVGIALEAVAFSSPAIAEARIDSLREDLKHFEKIWAKDKRSVKK